MSEVGGRLNAETVNPSRAQETVQRRGGRRRALRPVRARSAAARSGALSRTGAVSALLAITALGLGVAAVMLMIDERLPDHDSPEVGFARDMIVHHEQAVRMALLILERTEDPAIRSLAKDILLSQQNQIGLMTGWLDAWDAPLIGDDAPMAWMGHAGPMPGMAKREELAALSTLPLPEAEIQFLRLMIRHHQGAIPMADAILTRTDRKQVRRLAEGVIAAQRTEIAYMQELLAQRGASNGSGATPNAHNHRADVGAHASPSPVNTL